MGKKETKMKRVKHPKRSAAARRTWQSPTVCRRRLAGHAAYFARVRAGLALLAEKEAAEAKAENKENSHDMV
jgi:hypothetical protein